MKNSIQLCAAILLLTLASCSNESITEPTSNLGNDSVDILARGATSTTEVIYQFGIPVDQSEIYGTSKLVRNKNGIIGVYKTSNLIPGNAYTIWAVVINRPDECDGVPCRLDEIVNTPAENQNLEIKADALLFKGFVADSDEMTLAGHIRENDGSTSVNTDMGLPNDVGGLWDAEIAEVHFVLRDHGVAIPGLIYEQTATFNGGCGSNLNDCFMKQASIHSAE